jgi:hypothetical protein
MSTNSGFLETNALKQMPELLLWCFSHICNTAGSNPTGLGDEVGESVEDEFRRERLQGLPLELQMKNSALCLLLPPTSLSAKRLWMASDALNSVGYK